MQIKEIMSKNIETVTPEITLNEVARRMHKRDCGCLLVLEDENLVGIITDRDLVIRAIAEGHSPLKATAKEIMSSNIYHCRDTDESLAVSLSMAKNQVRRLPVLNEDNRLVGIVSLGDMAANLEDHNICGKALGHICAVPSG